MLLTNPQKLLSNYTKHSFCDVRKEILDLCSVRVIMASNVKKEKKAKLNTFQNDGSFMEMFKKSQESSQPVPPTSSEEKEKSKPNTEADIPCYSTQTMCYRDEKGGESSSIKSRYQVIHSSVVS